MADSGSVLLRRRQAREAVVRRRSLAASQLALGVVLGLQAAGRWANDGFLWFGVVLTLLALASAGLGLFSWRGYRRERAELAELVGVDLRPVAEATLSRLVAAALQGAAADEVTPPITPGEEWTPERIEWLRAFHRDRRRGLDGPAREATWAVVEIAADAEAVVGSVRLRRTGGPGTFETGIWLVRDARGRGIGRSAIPLLLDRALEAGGGTVRAETSPGNVGAVSLLRSSGFAMEDDGDSVRAELTLPH